METIIHIGQHKTGTISIQKYLHDNREAYIKKGLYVPNSIANYRDFSHFILNVYALNRNRYSTKKLEIIKNKGESYIDGLEIILQNDIRRIYHDAKENNCSKVLWSNEGLYLLNSELEYKRLIDLFSRYSKEVNVICCFRDVKSYQKSYINQLKKQNIKLSNDPNSSRYLKSDSWLFNYDRKKELLSKTFEKCIYFQYEPNDNVKAFMKQIGFIVNDSISYRLNKSTLIK